MVNDASPEPCVVSMKDGGGQSPVTARLSR